MEISEKELKDILMEDGYFSDEETKFEKVIHFIETEFKIGQERIDILGADEDGILYVIELKKGMIDGNAVVQALSYTSQLNFMLRNSGKFARTILVGNSIEQRTEKAILNSNDICFVRYAPSVKFFDQKHCFSDKFYDVELKETVEKLIEISNDNNVCENEQEEAV